MSRIKAKEMGLDEKLAAELSKTGIAFRADAWENKAPNNYGVVEITGQDKGEWADGRMIDQTFSAEITLYVGENGKAWVKKVQEKLEEMDAGYSLPTRQYLPDIGKTMWVWKASFYQPLGWTEYVEA